MPFYAKDQLSTAFESGKTISLKEGKDRILDALEKIKPGDILLLKNGGTRFSGPA